MTARSSPAAILFALVIAEITVTFESSMIYAALPTLIRQFGDPSRAGWLVTSHLLIAAATAPVFGRLGDIRGRKRLIMVLLAVSLIGSVISAVTTSFELVLLGRALQGLSAAVLPLSIGVAREALAAERVPTGIGILTSGSAAGAAAGLVLGGVIVDHLNWHWLFVASAVLIALSMLAVAALIPTMPGSPPRHRIDWLEGLLPVPGLAALLFALDMTKRYGWLSPQVWGLLAVGLAIMLLWARRSLASEEPFIDLRLFRQHNFAVINLSVVLMGMSTMQIIYVFSAYLQSPGWTAVGLGLTATAAGLAKLPSNLGSLFAGPLAGKVTQRFGYRPTLMAGAGLAAAGWLAAMLLPGQLGAMIALLCVISFGTTILQATVPNVIVDAVPMSRTSEAIGSMSVVRGIAATLGAQMIAMLLASSTMAAPGVVGTGGAHFPTAEAYRLTMAVIATLTIAAGAMALLLRGAGRPVAAAAMPGPAPVLAGNPAI